MIACILSKTIITIRNKMTTTTTTTIRFSSGRCRIMMNPKPEMEHREVWSRAALAEVESVSFAQTDVCQKFTTNLRLCSFKPVS